MGSFNILPIKTKKQMAEEYQVCERTFRRWVQAEQLDLPKRYLTPREQRRIYDCFGLPPKPAKDKR